MDPGDALAHRVRQYVATQVPPEQVEIVTRATCVTLVMLMSDPSFTNELVIVRQLRDQNIWLQNNLNLLKHTLATMGVKPTAPRKRAAPRKAPAVRKKSPSKSAFQRGRHGG